MAIKIGKQISEFEVVPSTRPDLAPEKMNATTILADTEGLPANVVQMHEKVERPETLVEVPTRSKHRYQTMRCT